MPAQRGVRASPAVAAVDAELAELAVEFDLGTPTEVVPLVGGGPAVVRLTTTRGSFVVKPFYRASDIELYARVEEDLNARGIRQARLFRTVGGEVVGSAGLWVQEFLPGILYERPTHAQADATMRHLAAYDQALATISVPAALEGTDTIWTRVVSPDYLSEALPRLMATFGVGQLSWLRAKPVGEALELLARSAPALAALPRQLVHGDIGPDNVLYEAGGGDDVVAILDFTPFHAPALFGLATALYWYYIRPVGGRETDRPGLRSGLAAYDERRPLTDAEHSLVAPMLLREGLRRLATALAVAEATGEPLNVEPTRRRYDALVRLLPLARAADPGAP